MASGLLNSRHVQMRGSSVVYGRGAQLESPVAADSGSKGTMDRRVQEGLWVLVSIRLFDAAVGRVGIGGVGSCDSSTR
jgi:hypothetical protein